MRSNKWHAKDCQKEHQPAKKSQTFPYFSTNFISEPWIKAKAIHNFLELSTIAQTLERVHEEDKASLRDLVAMKGLPLIGVGVSDTPTPNHTDYHEGKTVYVNESGMYAIIMKSTSPLAGPFQRWVTTEVLPAIRATGGYGQQVALHTEAIEALLASQLSIALPTALAAALPSVMPAVLQSMASLVLAHRA